MSARAFGNFGCRSTEPVPRQADQHPGLASPPLEFPCFALQGGELHKSNKPRVKASTLIESREFLGGAATLPYTHTGSPRLRPSRIETLGQENQRRKCYGSRDHIGSEVNRTDSRVVIVVFSTLLTTVDPNRLG
jgi:hypothetical protein